MAFSDQLTTDEAVFYNTDEFAVTITYGGSSIDAIVTYGGANTSATPGRRNFQIDQAHISVKKSDVATPSYRTAVVISGTTYYVQEIEEGDELNWILGLETDERPELYG